MADRIESMQIDVDEIRRNRVAIAEMEKGLNSATEIINSYASAIDELVGALNDLKDEFARVFPIYYYSEPWALESNSVWNSARATITKYNHIVDANKMVLPALYLCTKCGGANYGCGCDSFKHCTVPLYTNQTKKE